MEVSLGFIYQVVGQQTIELAAARERLAQLEAIERRLDSVVAAVEAGSAAEEAIGDGAVYAGGETR